MDRADPASIDLAGQAVDATPPQTVPPIDRTMSESPPAFSLMITRRQRAALRDLGLSDATIREMTPQEAHRLLSL